MRKRNLKLSTDIRPSRTYLVAVLGLHTLASLASLFMLLPLLQHIIVLVALAGSLCAQLIIYSQHAKVFQLILEGDTALLKTTARLVLPLDEAGTTQLATMESIIELKGELMPKAWCLPGLIVIYFKSSDSTRYSVAIFRDSVNKDDFRKLKIFILSGPINREHLAGKT